MKDSNIKKNKTLEKLEKYQIQFYDWLTKYDKRSATIIGLVAAVLITFISLPHSLTITLPDKESDIGKIMKFSINANRDYKVVDDDETNRNRIEAGDAVLNHYRFVDNADSYKKIKDTFGLMRSIAEEIIVSQLKQEKRTDLPAEFVPLYAAALVENLYRDEFKQSYNKCLDAFDASKGTFEKELGFAVDDSLFRLLKETLFSSETESAVFEIINKLNGYYITKEGVAEGYKPDKIVIKKSGLYLKRPVAGVITAKTLSAEIKYAQKVLGQQDRYTEKGLLALAAFAGLAIKDNITFDPEMTDKKKQEAWDSAPKVVFTVKNGEIIRRAGEQITAKDIKIFKEIKKSEEKSWIRVFIQNLLYILAVILAAFYAFKRSVSKFSFKNKDILLMGSQAVISFLLWALLVSLSVPFSQWMGNIDPRIFFFFLPFPFAVATVRLLINTETSMFFLLTLLLFFLTLFPENFYFPAYYCISSLAYIYLVTHIETRSNIIKISAVLSLFQMLLTILVFGMDFTLPADNLFPALFISFFGSILSGFLLMGVIPLWEWWLGYTTDITFLEYSSLNHPIMKRMAVFANGSYQHSLSVGLLVEAAAREVGLSPLACKVMAYFHDIGKLDRPEYFSENQTGKNKHDELSPSMSAKIIVNHIKSGVEMAREYKLGEKIESAIAQHQGTALVKYFFEKAKKEDPNTPEEFYRYPGPKPKTRETGLVMLGDSVEAAIKSMPDKNFQKITSGVHNIITRITEDGQLSECNMTMKDISKIEQSFIKTLSGIYHARVEYQQPVA